MSLLLWMGVVGSNASDGGKQWVMFFASFITSAWLVIRVGRGLLLSRDGVILAHSPISNRRILFHEFFTLPFELLLMAFGAWLFFRQLYPPSLIGFAVLSWMLVPLLAIAWQFQRRGRSGPYLFRAGIFAFVCFLFFGWLEQILPRLTPFDEVLALVKWLPANWFFNGVGGALLAGGVLSLSVLAIRRGVQRFQLRATPGAQARFLVTESEEEPNEVVLVAPLRKNVEKGPNFVTRACQLFWNEEERLLGEALRFGYSKVRFWIWTAFMAFLVALWWLPSSIAFQDPEIGVWFSVVGPLVVVLVLTLVWKSMVLATAFSKFALPGDRFVALAASLPISERVLFRMYLKEGLVGLLLIVPLQLLLIWMVVKRLEFEVSTLAWIFILLTICGIFVYRKLSSWTSVLWESLAFFQPGFRGDLKTSLTRLVFFLPVGLIAFAFVTNMGKWMATKDFPDIALLALAGGILWTLGGCWLVRQLYGNGRGSVVVLPAKKRSFRLF